MILINYTAQNHLPCKHKQNTDYTDLTDELKPCSLCNPCLKYSKPEYAYPLNPIISRTSRNVFAALSLAFSAPMRATFAK